MDEQAAPALAVRGDGQIAAINAAASSLLGAQPGSHLSSLGVGRDELGAFRDRLADAHGGRTLLTLSARTEGPIAFVGSHHEGHRAFLLVALQRHWPRSIDRALEELFELSASERQILAALAEGGTPGAIAAARGRSVGTVRQQIKSILKKLGVKTQAQAAAFAAAAASAMVDAASPESPARPLREDAPMELGWFLRGGRRVGFRRFGDPGGAKVLFLHGPSFGAGEFFADRRLSRELGLDVYALERPGYGRTHVPDRGQDPLGCQCDDALELLDREEISSATLLCHEVGLIAGLELARLRPSRVREIVSVSAAPPFVALEQIDAMPPQQAIFIQAARHAEWLARLMIKLLLVRIRSLGPERWYEAVFGDSPHELAVTRRPALREGAVDTYAFNHGQQGAGYETDLRVMLLDWRSTLSNVEAPLTLLHGEANPTTPLAHLELFRELRPSARIVTVAGEGLTLAVSRPDLVYAALAKAARRV